MGEDSRMAALFAFQGLRIGMSILTFLREFSGPFQKVTTVSFIAL